MGNAKGNSSRRAFSRSRLLTPPFRANYLRMEWKRWFKFAAKRLTGAHSLQSTALKIAGVVIRFSLIWMQLLQEIVCSSGTEAFARLADGKNKWIDNLSETLSLFSAAERRKRRTNGSRAWHHHCRLQSNHITKFGAVFAATHPRAHVRACVLQAASVARNERKIQREGTKNRCIVFAIINSRQWHSRCLYFCLLTLAEHAIACLHFISSSRASCFRMRYQNRTISICSGFSTVCAWDLLTPLFSRNIFHSRKRFSEFARISLLIAQAISSESDQHSVRTKQHKIIRKAKSIGWHNPDFYALPVSVTIRSVSPLRPRFMNESETCRIVKEDFPR